MKSSNRSRLPYFVLAVALAATLIATVGVHSTLRSKDQARFHGNVHRADVRIRNRLDLYIALLRSTAGLFDIKQNVTRSEFHHYVERLELVGNYPGIQGLGYSIRIPHGQTNELIRLMRSQGVEDFQIRPQDSREEYHSIIYLEPLDRRNLAAMGYDMFSEPTRRKAMERARDTGRAAASEKVVLVQEIDANKQAGFLIYLPVYAGGVIPETEELRRKLLQGFVFSPFRADDLFQNLLEEDEREDLRLDLYDGERPVQENLLFSTHKNGTQRKSIYATNITMELAGDPWLLSFHDTPHLNIFSTQLLTPLILFSGLFISFVLYRATMSQSVSESMALQYAENLKASENRFRQLFEQSPITIQILSPDGTTLEVNHAWEQLWESTRDQLTGYNIFKDPQLEQKGILPYLRRAFNGELVRIPPVAYDPAEIPRIGRQRWVEAVAFPIKNDDGSVMEVVLMLHDVTTRKEAEDRLLQIQAQFQSLFESNVIGIVVSNYDGRIIDANEAFLRFVGYSREDLIANRFELASLTPPEYHSADQESFQQVRDNGTCNPYEKEYFLRDGRRIPVLVGRAKLRGTENVAITFVLDLTELKAREKALRRTEARSAAILQTSLDAIITSDAEGRIIEWNPAAEQIFGYSREEVLGREMSSLIIPENLREAHKAGMKRYLSTGISRVLGRRIEMPALKKDGTVIQIELGITRIPAEGPLLFTATLRDITERKRVEKELKEHRDQLKNYTLDLEKAVQERTAKLAESNQALEAFSYSVSHDLKAPVRSMHGYASLLLEEYGDKIDEAGRRVVTKIQNSAVRMDSLIHDLLEFSRLSRLQIPIGPVELEHAVDEALDQQSTTIRERNAKIFISKPLPKVHANESFMVQILANLISNAIKFVPPDRTPEVRIWAEEAAREIKIWVEDNGIGIAEEYQERIFRIFERLKDLDAPGTGVGLAMIQKMVERMDGKVGLLSKVNNGTRFWVQLKKP